MGRSCDVNRGSYYVDTLIECYASFHLGNICEWKYDESVSIASCGNTKGDLRFTLFEYSNKQIEPLQRIKIHHEDEVDVDAHWQPTPMFELNSGLTHKDVSVSIQGKQETKILTILHSIGITAGNRSWQQDGNGDQIIQILSKAFGGKAAADAFYSVARFHLGSQIELQLTPKVGCKKYGDK
ncbi:MAG: hypothetical protein EZS28_027930, partial [Streblomastix strix]